VLKSIVDVAKMFEASVLPLEDFFEKYFATEKLQ